MEYIDPIALFKNRAGQNSFHVVSEFGMRVEFMRFDMNQHLGPIRYKGQLLVQVFGGAFVTLPGDQRLAVGTQMFFSNTDIIHLQCKSDSGELELIWAPPFGEVERL